MSSVIAYKVALIVFLTAVSGSTAGVVYYYQGRTTHLNSQLANLSNQNNSQNGQIASLKSQIDNLTRQIVQLQSIDSQLANEIAQLLAGNAGLCSSDKTLAIGELTDLSDGLSTQGIRAKDASLLAINDINSFLSLAGCNLKFVLAVDDYALDNAKALTDLQSFAASGVQVVVGPLNSGAAQFILSFANSNHIVLISPSSTSLALAIPNDYLFRTASNDGVQALADARMMIDRGATALIIVQRHDTFGDFLANATATRFKVLGGRVIDTIQYPADPIADWTPTLNSLNSEFNAARAAGYPANQIGIDVIAFEEFGGMILKAKSSYPAFPWSTLPWFGTDGLALDSVIVNAPYGSSVSQVVLPSTVYAPVNNTKTLALDSKFASTYPGNLCDSFCSGAYDDVWLAALATLQVGSYNGTKIQAILPTVASNMYGVTGWMGLDPNGDRVPISYQIWKVVNQGSPATPTWVLAGSWDAFTDTITWTSPP